MGFPFFVSGVAERFSRSFRQRMRTPSSSFSSPCRRTKVIQGTPSLRARFFASLRLILLRRLLPIGRLVHTGCAAWRRDAVSPCQSSRPAQRPPTDALRSCSGSSTRLRRSGRRGQRQMVDGVWHCTCPRWRPIRLRPGRSAGQMGSQCPSVATPVIASMCLSCEAFRSVTSPLWRRFPHPGGSLPRRRPNGRIKA